MQLWRVDAADAEEADYVTLFFRTQLAAEIHAAQMLAIGWECEIYAEELPIVAAEVARLVGQPGPLPWPSLDSADLLLRLRRDIPPAAKRDVARQLDRMLACRNGSSGKGE